jgi:hypothetical protein
MYVSPPQTEYVLNILKNINATNAVGTDGFLMEHLKQSANNSVVFLCILINLIISKETWPEKLKTQILRPIFKKGKTSEIDNYRPIAILPVVDKVIEKFFANQIKNFFTKHNVFTEKQYGFQEKKGTTEALKSLNEVVVNALNQGKFVGAVLIDLQKAFDTINKQILLTKFKIYGIRGKIFEILKSYLNARRSVTKTGQALSESIECNDGIPQGSVFGPLFFLIYINDLGLNIEDIILFADDIFLYSAHFNHKSMVQNLQKNFNIVQKWCWNNEVFISEEKTVFLEIKTPHAKIVNALNIYLHKDSNMESRNRIALNKVDNAKYLGLFIDNHWKQNTHILNLVKKLQQMMPKLYKLRQILNIKNRKLVYEAWIESLLRYGIEIYGFANASLIMRLQRVQNKIEKILFQVTKHKLKSAKQLMFENKILDVLNLRNYIIVLKYYFEIKKKINKLSDNSILRPESIKLKLPLWRNVYGKMTKMYYIPQAFNALPYAIKNLDSYNILKKNLKIHYLNKLKLNV